MPDAPRPLADQTVDELKQIASDAGYSGYSQLNKADLIAFIQAGGQAPAAQQAPPKDATPSPAKSDTSDKPVHHPTGHGPLLGAKP